MVELLSDSSEPTNNLVNKSLRFSWKPFLWHNHKHWKRNLKTSKCKRCFCVFAVWSIHRRSWHEIFYTATWYLRPWTFNGPILSSVTVPFQYSTGDNRKLMIRTTSKKQIYWFFNLYFVTGLISRMFKNIWWIILHTGVSYIQIYFIEYLIELSKLT